MSIFYSHLAVKSRKPRAQTLPHFACRTLWATSLYMRVTDLGPSPMSRVVRTEEAPVGAEAEAADMWRRHCGQCCRIWEHHSGNGTAAWLLLLPTPLRPSRYTAAIVRVSSNTAAQMMARLFDIAPGNYHTKQDDSKIGVAVDTQDVSRRWRYHA